MKMSDVFNLPLKVDGSTVYDLRDSVWLGNPSLENNYWFGVQNTKASELEKDSTALIIAECVNQHDQLTAINQELVEALEDFMSEGKDYCSDWLMKNSQETIKRAKELTNEMQLLWRSSFMGWPTK